MKGNKKGPLGGPFLKRSQPASMINLEVKQRQSQEYEAKLLKLFFKKVLILSSV